MSTSSWLVCLSGTKQLRPERSFKRSTTESPSRHYFLLQDGWKIELASPAMGPFSGLAKFLPYPVLVSPSYSSFRLVAVPGTNGFVGELLILFGLFIHNPWASAILALNRHPFCHLHAALDAKGLFRRACPASKRVGSISKQKISSLALFPERP